MDPDQADLACLLVSEVVTNAVLHAAADHDPQPGRAPADGGRGASTGASAMGNAGTTADAAPPGLAAGEALAVDVDKSSREFRVRLRRGADSVWVEVFDPDLRLPRIRSAGADRRRWPGTLPC